MKRIKLDDLARMLNEGHLECAEYCYCCDKIRYATRQDAAKAGAEIARAGKGRTRPYECLRRGGWHLTAREKRQPSGRYGDK